MKWSEHDIQVLKDNYGKIKTKEILPLLDKEYTYQALRAEVDRLGLRTGNREKWTKEEEDKLIEIYPTKPMNEVLETFSYRSEPSIKGKAQQLHLHSYFYLTNKYSNEDLNYLRDNYLQKTNDELAEVLNRKPEVIQQRLWLLGLKRPKERTNYDSLNFYIRTKLTIWKNQIKSENNWTCCVTGNRSNIVLHHCRSVNLLILETIEELNFQVKENFEDYTQEELDIFVEKFFELQEYYGEYVCITESIHKLFHKEYGYGNNTIEQWNEFVDNYNNHVYANVA